MKLRLAAPLTVLAPLLLILGVVFTPAPAGAYSFAFDATRIIDDAIFYNANSMNAQSIQSFLNSKVPVCDTNGSKPYGGTTRAAYSQSIGKNSVFVCVKDYYENPSTHENNLNGNPIPSGAMSAAQIIYNAAQQYRVNPQVLIVLIQREQGLITDDWPWVTPQYSSATGYGCPDSGPNHSIVCNSQYFGFYNQVFLAARQFRLYADNPNSYNYVPGRGNFIQWSPQPSCGGTIVNIQNQATASLYNYAPYRPNDAALAAGYGTGDACSSYANRNFWLYFNDWFGPTVAGKYPSPLYKSDTADTIYAVANNTKYPIANFYVLNAYGWAGYPVSVVPDSIISGYTTGPTLTSPIAKKQDDPGGTLYLFDDGKRYPINIQACKYNPDGSTISNTTWGLDCFNSNVSYSLPNALIDRFTAQDITIPNVILYDNSAWKLEGGKKRRITDPVFVDILGGWGNTRWMKDINASQPEGKLLIPDNTLVKFDNGPVIYLLVNAQLYPIPGPDEFSAWGLGSRKIYSLPAAFNASDPLSVSGTNLQFFAKDSGNTPYVLFNNSQKTSVAGNSYWNTSTYSQLPDYILNSIPTVAMPPVFRSTNGEIFIVQNDKKRPFPSIDDLVYSGYNPGALQPASQLIGNKFTYDGAKLSAGRLFKVAGSDVIRYVYGEGASLQVNSSNIPGLPYNKLITVDATTAAHYPIVGVY
jgi:hypothetical protein